MGLPRSAITCAPIERDGRFMDPLADDENPNAETNFYVGRYLIDEISKHIGLSL